MVQAYASHTFGWRGAFAVHTWLAAKPAGADHYTRYEVIGWYARSGHSAVSVTNTPTPDTEWYGSAPRLIRDLRGADAEAVIGKLEAAVASYPYPDLYRAWPGPNSNTFLAHLGRAVPELRLTLPSTAIGKDYLPARPILRPHAERHGLPGVAVGPPRRQPSASTKGWSSMFSASSRASTSPIPRSSCRGSGASRTADDQASGKLQSRLAIPAVNFVR